MTDLLTQQQRRSGSSSAAECCAALAFAVLLMVHFDDILQIKRYEQCFLTLTYVRTADFKQQKAAAASLDRTCAQDRLAQQAHKQCQIGVEVD